MTASAPVRYARWDGVGARFVVATTSAPAPLRAGHALVRIGLATVCGSDLHTVLGHRRSPSPSVLGHEQVGVVAAVSTASPPRYPDGSPLLEGDRVVWSVTASCGHCDRCRGGLGHKCRTLRKYGHQQLTRDWLLSGGFATHCELVAGTTVVRVPDHVPDAVAAPASCATATVAAALAAAGPLAGRRVLVTGAGLLGVTATAMATEAGAEVAVVDPDPARRALAARFGAVAGIGTDSEISAVGDFGEVDVAVELSGHPGAVERCLASLRTGGRAVLAGSVSAGRPAALDAERLVRGLHTLTGVYNYRPADLVTAVGFLAEHHRRYPFAEIIGPGRPLDGIDAAINAAGADPNTLRQAVAP
ncbi:MAG TPA: alcohol dehydrogenase catalytic domain-containing protein [Pseudonocardia sp.]|nr:alcohol dehydrogenase catalytic domain-containing protein [Pseudonocardia sp.]